MYNFNAEKETINCIEWIKDWFENNGKNCIAIIGISGGKDSSICASLCVKALGKDRVFGVLLPQGIQHDIDYSIELCKFLDIKYKIINIKDSVESVIKSLGDDLEISVQTKINLPARIRMATLYAVSQSMNGRVVNTCNYSEDYVGYSTKYGDAAGDFSPISSFTVTEVKMIGRCLGLPDKFVEKTPIDGLSNKTDEENLGFTYEELDKYIRQSTIPSEEKKQLIDSLHEKNLFKLKPIPKYIKK